MIRFLGKGVGGGGGVGVECCVCVSASVLDPGGGDKWLVIYQPCPHCCTTCWKTHLSPPPGGLPDRRTERQKHTREKTTFTLLRVRAVKNWNRMSKIRRRWRKNRVFGRVWNGHHVSHYSPVSSSIHFSMCFTLLYIAAWEPDTVHTILLYLMF